MVILCMRASSANSMNIQHVYWVGWLVGWLVVRSIDCLVWANNAIKSNSSVTTCGNIFQLRPCSTCKELKFLRFNTYYTWRLPHFFLLSIQQWNIPNHILLVVELLYDFSLANNLRVYIFHFNLLCLLSVSFPLSLYFSSFLAVIIHSLLHNFYAKLISRAHIILPQLYFYALFTAHSSQLCRHISFFLNLFFFFCHHQHHLHRKFLLFACKKWNGHNNTIEYPCKWMKWHMHRENKITQNFNDHLWTVYGWLSGVHETIERIEICIWK